ncbi:ANK3, partial [Symbiodinium sp. KB8]
MRPVHVVKDLPTPWPRCQELVRHLGAERKTPTRDDLVLAVSHAWSHQLHPDPLGRQAETIKQLTEEAVKDHQIKGDAMLFYDFMSMSQNPFQPGQTERSPQEQADFLKAIDALPEVFFTADAVLHVEGNWPELECEGQTRKVSMSELNRMKLKQHGSAVMMYDEYPANDGSVAELPVFTIRSDPSLGDIKSIDDVYKLKRGKEGGCLPCRRLHRLHKLRPKSEAEAETDPVFIVQPSPMGKRNAVPAGERGWIYFERLVSTIRVALTDEQYARTVYANAPDLKESILARAQKLRQCAAQSNKALKAQFEDYIEEIKQKTFSATSLDKKKASTKNTATDVDLVFSLLTQLRRRVSLALAMTVRSLSVEDCAALLAEQADLSIQDGRGYTPLHNAARFRNVEVVQLLLDNAAKRGARDRLGNTPAHVIPLYADEITVGLLQLLADDAKNRATWIDLAEVQAASEVEFADEMKDSAQESQSWQANWTEAGLSVLNRMESWALVAVNGGPYQPMMDWKKAEYPDLIEKSKADVRCLDANLQEDRSFYCTNSLFKCYLPVTWWAKLGEGRA